MGKFQKGPDIATVFQLAQNVLNGSWVYYKGKPLHPNFVLHMTFATVLGGLKANLFTQALPSEKEVKP